MSNKISVLIPTYNRPNYLIQALQSVLTQTLMPYEIIICDDNINSDVNLKVLEPYLGKYDFIKYIKNEKNLGPVGNYLKTFELASGDYIKWLADDDILLPKALEKLSYYLDNYPNVKLVTSSRIAVDDNLRPLRGIKATEKLFYHDTIVDGKQIVKKTLVDFINYIGEFSTVLFRKRDIDFTLFELEGRQFRANCDWLTWIFLALKGDVAYIAEPLSLFRLGQTSDQFNPKVQIEGARELLLFCFSSQLAERISLDSYEKARQIAILFGYQNRLKKSIAFTSLNEMAMLREIEDESIEKTKHFLKSISIYPHRSSRKAASIIIVTHNSERTIGPCLDSVLRYKENEDEIIVVDNASSDATVQIVKKYKDPKIKLIINDIDISFSASINRGIKESQNDMIVFLKPDTIVTPGWLDTLAYHLYLDERTGAVGPLTDYVISSQNIYSYISIPVPRFNYDEIALFVKHLFPKTFRVSKLLIDFCLATKKSILDKIGLLDEKLFLVNEDLELSWRLREHGYNLKIALDAFIHHEGEVSFKTETKSYTNRLIQESTNQLANKLIAYYGYGNVPHPEKLWGIDWFISLGDQYRYMFTFKDSPKPQDFYKKIAIRLKNNPPKVAVILVNYRNASDTIECIRSLQNSNYTNFYIITVDNSEDPLQLQAMINFANTNRFNTIALKEGERPEFKPTPRSIVFIEASRNLGYAHGNNLGIRYALEDGVDYIWILNNDTIIPQETLYELIRTSLFMQAEVVTCKIKDFIQQDKLQYNGKQAAYEPFADEPDIIKVPKFLSGANILVKSDVFDVIGLFDEDYFLYFEDNDWHQRLQNHNILVLYTPFAVIYHKGGATIGRPFANTVSSYYFVRNSLLFLKKNHLEKLYLKRIEEILGWYNANIQFEEILRAILQGVYDFILGVSGRKEGLEELTTIRDQKIPRVELARANTDKLGHSFRLSMIKPWKVEYVKNFFIFVEEYLREKLWSMNMLSQI